MFDYTSYVASTGKQPQGHVDAAEKIARAFLVATKEADNDAIKAVLTKKGREKYSDGSSGPPGPRAGFKIGEVTITGETAQVQVELIEEDGAMPGYIRLRREDGTWRVVGIGLGEGNRINAGSFSFSSGRQTQWALEADKKLPSDTKLKIILGGKAKVVTIPFKFEDVPLEGN